MAKENLLEGHLHLHSGEIVPGRWLLHKPGIRAKYILDFAWGMLLGMGIIGVAWLMCGR